MKRVFLLILFSVFLTSAGFSQYFDAQKNWRRYRHELTIAGGVANYMGDLGGLDGPGIKYFIVDLEFSQFKKAFQVGYRYNLSYKTAMSHKFFYGSISGSDALTGNPNRSNRNLSFQSNVYTYNANFEYHFIRSRPGHIYNLKGAKGLNSNPFGLYAFVGVGGFYFNPKAELNGTLYELQPLGTEGQGLPGAPKRYSRFNVNVPVGYGVTFRLPFNLKLGAEFSYHFTFTDYLDDVSGFYYDNSKIREAYGDAAAALADRSPANGPDIWTTAGAIRGNPKNNDAFLNALVTLTYSFYNRKAGPSRPTKHPFLRKK